MDAVVVERLGGPEVLTVAERDALQAGPGQGVVRVGAAGVNYMDICQREGLGAYRRETPFVLGMEGAGTVVAVRDAGSGDAGAGQFEVGDIVAWASAAGSYAEETVVPADRAVRVPDGVRADIAAALMPQGLTAHYLCVS